MKATLTSYKTENQIYADFISLIQQSFNAFGIKGWQIRQLNQVFKVNVLKSSVFITITGTSQRGRQYQTKTKNKDGILVKTHFTKQEVKLRFSSTHRERTSDTVNSINSNDILKIIREYMQSEEGILFLADKGYAQYTAAEISDQQFTNDEDNFQFLPYFDCTFVYTNTWTTEVGEITKAKEKGIFRI